MPHTLHPYEHDPHAQSFGLEAAAALGVDPGRVYKTLIVDTSAALAVGVVPVTCSLDLKALATALDAKKVHMATHTQAERSTGMVVGGISPVGQRSRLHTVLDDSMQRHPTVLVSAGRRGLDIELSPQDLATITEATFVRIRRD